MTYHERRIQMPPKPEKGLREIDIRAGVNTAIAAILYFIITALISGADNYLNICVLLIAVGFVTEKNWKATWSAGLSRCMIIGIGVVFGMIVVFLDNLTGGNNIITALLTGVFAALALVVEKYTGKMYVQCKLGLVAYTLTIFTFRGAFYAQMGKSCYQYGIMFFISTVAAALIAACGSWIYDFVKAKLGK